MRLREIDRGDSIVSRLLISFISLVSGMRLPDAARVAFYHKEFFSAPMGEWTQAAVRGPSEWSVGERELMAALVAKWNSCSFCVNAHGQSRRKSWSGPRLMRHLLTIMRRRSQKVSRLHWNFLKP